MMRDTCHWCGTGSLTVNAADDRCAWCILAGIGPQSEPAPLRAVAPPTLAQRLHPWMLGALLAALMLAPVLWIIAVTPQP